MFESSITTFVVGSDVINTKISKQFIKYWNGYHIVISYTTLNNCQRVCVH